MVICCCSFYCYSGWCCCCYSYYYCHSPGTALCTEGGCRFPSFATPHEVKANSAYDLCLAASSLCLIQTKYATYLYVCVCAPHFAIITTKCEILHTQLAPGWTSPVQDSLRLTKLCTIISCSLIYFIHSILMSFAMR